MSASIDERVVSMKFQSNGFKSGIDGTKKALQDLKTNLNFDKAKASLQSFKGESGRFNLSNMQQSIEGLSQRFSALRVAGVAALATLASQAVIYGQKIVQGLISPIKQGFEEYETNLNAVQTILANTQPAGTGLKEVNAALQELNLYSDQTIYNFSEMAKNIGTFTAAGVALGPATSAIKGIANLAALSGSNSQQASTAMYQLSQAISAGKVGLQDWNSVVNAGMGGTIFQRALAQNAVKMGKLSASAVQLSGDMKNVKIDGESFRDSISATGGKASWLTSDVLTSTLAQFTGDLKDADLAAQGFNASEIKAIQQQAKTAKAAATEVKTFTQLMGTLAEAQGSGWSQSFQLIFGDFEQAKQLFTGISNELGGLISMTSNARNKILSDWQAAGGRDAAIDTVKNLWAGLLSIIKPVKEAFREIFPPIQGKTLAEMTKNLRDFTAGLKLGGPAAENLKSTFKGIFAIFSIGITVIKGVLGFIGKLFSAFSGGGADASGGILNLTGSLGDFLVSVDAFLKKGDLIGRFFTGLAAIIAIPIKALVAFAGFVGEAFKSLFTLNFDGLTEAFGRFGDRLAVIGKIGPVIGKALAWVGKQLGKFGDWLKPGLQALGDFGKNVFEIIKDGLASGDFKGVLDLLNTGFIAGIFLLFKNFFGNLKGLFGGKGGKGGGGGGFFENLLSPVKEVFGGLTDTLTTMQNSLKAKTLLTIALAVGVLAASVIALSLVDSERLTAALLAITVMFGQMAGTLAVFTKIAGLGGIAQIPIMAGALVILGAAVLILASAVSQLAKLDWNELARGLTGLVVILGSVVAVSRTLKKQVPEIYRFAGAMVVLGVAIKIMASAVQDFASLNWNELAKGIGGFAAVLAAVSIFNKYAAVNKGAAISGVNILLLSAAMKLFASAVGDFAKLDLAAMAQGLIGVGVMLKLLAGFTNNAKAFKGIIQTGVALVILAAGMKILASAVQDFASLDWNELARGLLGMAVAMGIMIVALNAMPASTLLGAAALVVAAAGIKILASALQSMGGMSWGDIGKAMVVLAGSIVILALGLTAMIFALPGAAALIVAAGALAVFAPVLALLGTLDWGTIWTGLGAIALSLGLLAVAGVALLPAIPGLVGLGIALGLIGLGVGVAALGLGTLATSLVALGAAGPLAATGITAMATAILNLLPLAMQKLGEGVVAFADVIGNSGPTLVAAFTTLILSLLTSINTVAPQILNTMVGLIMGLLDTIQKNLPQFIAKGGAIIIGFLNGIAAQMPGIVNAAVTLIVNFINGIARNMNRIVTAGTNLMIAFIQSLSKNAQRLATAGADAVIDFVRGISATIRTKSAEMRAAGAELAGAIISGMTGGLSDKAAGVIAKAGEIANNVASAAKAALNINSPSRVFRSIGRFVMDGWGIGINDGESKVIGATESAANNAISTMKESVRGLSATLTDNMDTSPTIRPILDLSAVRKGSGQISGMMGVASIKATTAYASASAADTGYSDNRAAAAVASTPTVIDNSKVITLKQENSSPLPLNTSDIYRNTRNLMSQIEQEVSK